MFISDEGEMMITAADTLSYYQIFTDKTKIYKDKFQSHHQNGSSLGSFRNFASVGGNVPKYFGNDLIFLTGRSDIDTFWDIVGIAFHSAASCYEMKTTCWTMHLK